MPWLLCFGATPLAQCMKRKDWGEAREEKAPWRLVRRCAKGQPGSGVNAHTDFTSCWATADAEIPKELIRHHGGLGSPDVTRVFLHLCQGLGDGRAAGSSPFCFPALRGARAPAGQGTGGKAVSHPSHLDSTRDAALPVPKCPLLVGGRCLWGLPRRA